MNNLQRLQLETKGINLDQNEITIYLQENNLQPFDEYDPNSASNIKHIYQSALSVLESLANNPNEMRNINREGMSISDFADNIQNRIDQLESKIRKLKTDEQVKYDTNFFMLFD